MSMYPDGMSGRDLCHVEGCDGCSRCGGGPNYALLGYLGAVARWAKAWGVSKEEAERRMVKKEQP